MNRVSVLLATTLVIASTGIARAQAAGTATPTIKKELVMQLDDAQKKLVALASAIPPAKFSWRPGAGVRSVSEVFVHVAAENFEIPPMTGVAAAPMKVADNAEQTITDKAAVIDLLTKSFAYAKQSVSAFPDAQMNGDANYFGTPMSKRGVLIMLAVHGHEHLGQLIAYARMNSIVPPWSQ